MAASVTINSSSVFASSRGAATAVPGSTAIAFAITAKVKVGVAASLLAMLIVAFCTPTVVALNVTVNVAEPPLGTVPVPPETVNAGLLLVMPLTTRSPAAFGSANVATVAPPSAVVFGVAPLGAGAFAGLPIVKPRAAWVPTVTLPKSVPLAVLGAVSPLAIVVPPSTVMLPGVALAVQLAVVMPTQLQVHGPLPITGPGLPEAHRFVGVELSVRPLSVPQTPGGSPTANEAVIVQLAVIVPVV